MAKQKQSGLGRGIDALFGDMGLAEENTENLVQMIDLGLIDPNKEQPRKHFDADSLAQLADSIRSVGVIQPIVLSPNGRRYTIIAGERRWRAARLAELKEVPALVREVEDIRRMEMSLIENIQRTDLNAIEEARAHRGFNAAMWPDTGTDSTAVGKEPFGSCKSASFALSSGRNYANGGLG